MRFFNLQYISAGFVAVLVGYSSSAAIIFQAATAAGASAEQISSWLWALGMGTGIMCISLSLYYKQPLLFAWSTPGAALMAGSLSGDLSQAIGVFIFCSALITLCGVMGWFNYLTKRIPSSLAAAMLAGVLLQFGLHAFSGIDIYPTLIGGILLCYIFVKQLFPRYVIPITLLFGGFLAYTQGLANFDTIEFELSQPVFVMPSFSLNEIVGVGIPLFIVTMASQNLPGIAVMRANNWQAPASPLITSTGVSGLLLAPFGGFTFNLAAITAAICMGPEAGEDRSKRYMAAVWAGIFYLMLGIMGATIAAIFTAFPTAFVLAIAGLALISTISAGLAVAMENPFEREAALITFLFTASGMSLFDIGSPFWGILTGVLVLNLSKYRAQRA